VTRGPAQRRPDALPERRDPKEHAVEVQHRGRDWSPTPRREASFPAGSEAKTGRARWVALAATAAAGVLVFWLFDALPFQDLPAHAGLIALRQRIQTSPIEQAFFVVAPHLGPYSLFRGLGQLLVPALGPVGTVRAIATAPILALPSALLWARRRLHDDRSPTAAYLGLALGFGFMTLLGFASYLLGVAALIVGLTAWLELLAAVDVARADTARREAVVACAAPLVLFSHGFAFAIFIVLAVVAALATGRRWARLVRLRAFGPAGLVAAWALWSVRASALPPGAGRLPSPAQGAHFQGAYDKLSLLLTPTLMTRTGVDVLVGAVLWSLLALGVALTARSLKAAPRLDRSSVHTRALLACLVALAVAFIALPHSIGWFGFVDGRLVTVTLLIAAIAIRQDALGALSNVYERTAPLAARTMIAIGLVASYLFQEEARGWRDVFSHIPAGARLLNLPIEPNSAIFAAHPFVHYDKLVLADRPMVVSDVWFHQGSAVYPTADNPALRLPASYSESDLRRIDWPAYEMADWDYVLIRTRPDSPLRDVPNTLTSVAHQGGWWLFRTASTGCLAPSPRPSSAPR
jgi:hypothetical protein